MANKKTIRTIPQARTPMPEQSPEARVKNFDEVACGYRLEDALVESEPEKFMLPRASDLRYNWVVVRLEAIDAVEMNDLVVDAWAWCVPKSVAQEFARTHGEP